MRNHLLTLLLVALSCTVSWACQVPVFRYALENWEPDVLTVAVLHAGEPSAETEELVAMLEAGSRADERVNLRVHRIDIEADHPEGSPEAYYASKWKDEEMPHALVFFSNNAPEPQLAWSGPLHRESAQALLLSPKRKEVVERLLDGQTAVWILLKSGQKAADEAAEKVLREELAKKPDEIELPSLKDLESEERFNELLPVEMRVEFSIITLDPDEKDEAFFREMMLNTERDLKEFPDEPIAIPIYGRGRTYFALVGAGINADNIADNCQFICGACSCEVKRDNPGQDLLLAANWNRVQPGNWVNDTPLPALTGIGGFETMTEINDEASADASTDLVAKMNDTPAEPSKPSGSDIAAGQKDDAVTADDAEVAIDEPAQVADQGQSDATLLLLGWAGALFCVGLIFTIWRRTRITE